MAEITLQEARTQRSEIVYVRWLDDVARGTPEDPDAVRNRVDATQVNSYDREDVVQATQPTEASSFILSLASTKPNARDQHWSSSVGWRSMKAWYGRRETNKCWRIEIKNILMCESVVDVPTTCASENHGYVTVRRGTDFFSSGGAAARGAVERVQTAHFNTKIMPRIRPMVFGREMIEGHHLRRRRRIPQESEWESNSKRVDDMMELCRRKLDSKKTLTPVTKATEMMDWSSMTCREVAGTGASLTGSASTQFTMFVVHPEETWLHRHQEDPRKLYVHQNTDWPAEEVTGKTVLCTAGKHESQAGSDVRQSRNALSSREAESHGIVRGLLEMASPWRVRVAPPWIRQVGAGGTARVDGCIIRSRDDVKANLPDLGTDWNGSRGEDNL